MGSQLLKPTHLHLSSSVELTLADRRLYNYLLLNALDTFDESDLYTISLQALRGVYGNELPPANRMQESLRRLQRTLVEYVSEAGDWTVTSLLGDASLHSAQGSLSYRFPLACRPLLADPVLLERCLIQAHFTQKYSHYLYELLSTAMQQHQQTLSIETSELRAQLQVPATKLTNFSDFERFALLPACEEINAYASFSTKFDKLRKGIKVVEVLFYIFPKQPLRHASDPRQVIPVKRPGFFVENPALEFAYSQLLMAETRVRRQFFSLAQQKALLQQVRLPEEDFDRPDLWLAWVEEELIKNYS